VFSCSFENVQKKKRSVRIPFANPKHASIAKQVIEVDQELQPHAVIRELTIDGDVLLAYVRHKHALFLPFSRNLHSTFYTLTVRLARLTLNSFLENVDLVIRTIGQFTDDAEQQPASHSHPSA
jgi:EKC/KEOPS complex subunit PCC1/LAGE3